MIVPAVILLGVLKLILDTGPTFENVVFNSATLSRDARLNHSLLATTSSLHLLINLKLPSRYSRIAHIALSLDSCVVTISRASSPCLSGLLLPRIVSFVFTPFAPFPSTSHSLNPFSSHPLSAPDSMPFPSWLCGSRLGSALLPIPSGLPNVFNQNSPKLTRRLG